MSEQPTTADILRSGFVPFRGRSAWSHVAVLVAHQALWCVLFWGLVARFDSVLAVEWFTHSERLTNIWYAAISNAIIGVPFGYSTMKRFGGPGVNFLLIAFYPLIGEALVSGLFLGVPWAYAENGQSGLVSLLPVIFGLVTFFGTAILYTRYLMSDQDKDRWRESMEGHPFVVSGE